MTLLGVDSMVRKTECVKMKTTLPKGQDKTRYLIHSLKYELRFLKKQKERQTRKAHKKVQH